MISYKGNVVMNGPNWSKLENRNYIMVTFKQFVSTTNGKLTNHKQLLEKVFVGKINKNGAGKIELNCGSKRLVKNGVVWKIGFGTKFLAKITSALKAKNFTVLKTNTNYTVVAFTGVDQFDSLYDTVISAVPDKATRAVKTKTKSTTQSLEKSVADIAAIKAKNLETMRAVTARNKTKEVSATKMMKDVGLTSNKHLEGTPFAAPASISRADLKALV
jgi:hypothetical protein